MELFKKSCFIGKSPFVASINLFFHHSVPPQMDYSLALSSIQGPHEAKRGSLLFELAKMTVVHLHANYLCMCVFMSVCV